MPATEDEQPVTELLRLAIATPDAAEVMADRLLEGENTDPWVSSVAHQARGIVLRDRGRLDLAVPELRLALRLGRRSGDQDREADVRATLGVALAMAGRTRAGLEQLRRAADSTSNPTVAAKILVRRGHVLYFLLRRPREALADLSGALPGIRSAEERVWEARTLNLIGLSRLALGQVEPAARAVESAERIFVMEGQHTESIVTLHNRGYIAYCQGDLPLALRLYDEAAGRYLAIGEGSPALVMDQSDALLAAGLADEAVALVTDRLRSGSVPAAQEAELFLTQAAAQLADDSPRDAVVSATRARLLFRRQRRDWWANHAELAVLQSRHRSGTGGRRLAEAADRVGHRLQADGSEQAAAAWLLAGRVAAAAGLDTAGALLAHAARFRHRPSSLVSAISWHARALERDLRGDTRGVLGACRRGLDVLDEHRATFGSSELRAQAARHGDELAAVAMHHAAAGRPRLMLEWSERWRATALAQPPVRPPDDDELAASLAALRDTRRRLAAARAEGSSTASQLDDERTRLEVAIRRHARHLAGSAPAVPRFETDRLVAELGETTLVELVELDGVLHALVVRGGRVRRFTVGDAQEAEHAVAVARFTLRQAARGRPSNLEDVGRHLEQALLGESVRALGDGPVVFSPTSRLHSTPWAMVPALAEMPVSVVPSASLWLRARSAGTSSGARVLVAGPGLASGGAELDVLARRHPEALLLRDGTATVETSLRALDGAAVAHIAAHGRFREDSPMFSSLELDDGSLTVHDLERLDHAPHRVVLSACESGVIAPIGAGEMLGLVAAMLSMGTAGIVSSVAQVNDAATAELMISVHEGLDDREDLGTVLLGARRAARGDRVREATAAAFLAMGA